MEFTKINNKPMLAMGMPVYNEEKHIGEAIESLLAQTYKNFILIISDNASTDKTGQICENYAKKDKRIIYVRHEKNKGAWFNFHYVLEQSNTPFFMWCGGHDKWNSFFVEKLLPAVGKNDVILSCCKTGSIKLNGKMGNILRGNYDTMAIDKPAKRYLYLLRNVIHLSGIFHGIWLAKALKNCDFNLKSYAPDIIILEQASFEGKFRQNKEVLFYMRTVRGEETHSQREKRQFTDVTGKKPNVGALKIIYLLESVKIIFREKYFLSVVTKIWLTVNAVFFRTTYIFIRPAVNAALKKILPGKVYSELKSFLRSRN